MLSRRNLLAGTLAGGILSGAKTNYRLIDSHVHVWKRDPRFPWANETTHPPAEDATPEMLLALMKANGVERTVIIQVIHYRYDNSYLAGVLKQYPKYFRGVARVNPEDPAAPDRLSALTERGFQGVRISPAAGPAGDWIKGPLMEPLWKRCQDLKVPMTLLAPVSRMPDIQPLIERHADLTVVIDHMADCPLGQPDELKKLTALARYPKVFVKISHMWALSRQPYPYRDSEELVHKLYDEFGPKRLMWGTDWPLVEKYCTYAQTVALYRDGLKFLNAGDRQWILSGTVQRVWPFD
ncbi:MAG: amidohydrolase family protein [Bryobacteraceae bacterium]